MSKVKKREMLTMSAHLNCTVNKNTWFNIWLNTVPCINRSPAFSSS